MRRLSSIQHLRAAAAVAVVVYHACQWGHAGGEIAAAGVDLFFVISGFVMGLALADPALTPAAFLRRRLWRIAPAYWLVTLAVMLIAAAWPDLMPQVYPGPRHLILSLLFIPHVDPTRLPFPMLPVGWSLTYEMIFYLLVAACLTQHVGRRLAPLAAALIALPLFGVQVHPAFFLFANGMMLQFLAGVLIAVAGRHDALPRHGGGLGLIIIAGGLYSTLSWFDLYGSLWRPLVWGAPAALLVAGAVSLERERRWFTSRTLSRLGAASYSIYLCHWPVIVMLAMSFGARPPWPFVPLAIGAAIGTGLLFWRYVERPLLSWRRPGRPTVASAEAAA